MKQKLLQVMFVVFVCAGVPFNIIAQSSSPPAVLLKQTNALFLCTRPALGNDGHFYASGRTNGPNGVVGVLSIDSRTLGLVWGPVMPCASFGEFGVSVGANGLAYSVGDWNWCGYGPLAAFDANGSIIWEHGNGSPFPRLTPALNDQSSSAFFGSSTIEAVDYNTHASKWTSSDGFYIGGRGIAIDTSGNLYIGTEGGGGPNTRILSFTQNGTLRWERDFSTSYQAGPYIMAVPNSLIVLLYYKDINQLLAWNSSNGSNVWQVANLNNPVTDAVGNIFASAVTGGDIVSLTANGQERWRQSLAGITNVSVDFIDNTGRLYARAGNSLLAIKTTDGSLDWQFTADAPLNIPAALASGGRIYLNDSQGTSYLLNTALDYAPSSWPVAQFGNRRHTEKSGDILVNPPVVVVVQTNRVPMTNEIGQPTIPTDPTHFKVFTNGTFQSGIALDPNKMTIVLTHGWNSSPDDWAGYMAQLIKARLGTSTPNIVAWDWSADAASAPLDLPKIAAKTPGEGLALGTDLATAFGNNYSQRIHFIGHSLGTLVNATAANYLEANGYSWTNIQMTLCDDAEIASGFIGNTFKTVATLPTSATPQPFWSQPLPNQFAWADNYISAIGQLHPEAANVILTYLFPTSFPDRETFLNEFDVFHAYSYEWYDETIQSDASLMGFKWSFENGGFTGAPIEDTVFFQSPNGPELTLVQTNVLGATQFLNDRLTKYIGASELSVVQFGLNATVQAVGQVTGAIDNTGNIIVNLFTSIGSGSLVQSSARQPGGPVPNGEGANNTTAYAWIPISVPSNAISMSFDFMLQGNGNNDSFQAALNGTNVLSLETVLIQTNVTLNSGLIDVSQYAGTNVELFLGIAGGTSTNAQLTVSDIQFYSAALPSLQAQPGGGNIALTWPLSAQDFSLQTTTNLADPNSWVTLTNVPAIVNLQNTVTNPVSNGARFYRLKQ